MIKLPLWNIYSKLCNKVSVKFERKDTSKNSFIEDKKELNIIGKEISAFIKDNNIKPTTFIDVCSAPGYYSTLIINDFNSQGYGISLPPEKGGVAFDLQDLKNKDYFKFKYVDILKDKVSIDNKIDFGIASCVSYSDNDPMKMNFILIFKSLNILLHNLQKNGNIFINMTIKKPTLAYNFIFNLKKCFSDVLLFKSKNIWADKRTFYILAKNYNPKNNNDILQMIKTIDNDYFNFLKIYNDKNIDNIDFKIINQLNKILEIIIIAMIQNI